MYLQKFVAAENVIKIFAKKNKIITCVKLNISYV